MRRFLPLALMLWPGLAGAGETLTCKVDFTCSGGACRSATRTFDAAISMTGLSLEFDGRRVSLVALDRTSRGDRIFGGQLSDRLYGVFILKESGIAKLLVEGVNGWNEVRQEMMNCRPAKG